MSEKLSKHQLFEYDEKMPFQILGLRSDISNLELLESHWHEELELEYCISGHSKHYINGEVLVDEPGRLIVTNSEFVHSIIPDLPDHSASGMAVIVILIHRRYLEEIFPEYKFLYFTNDKPVASEQIRELIYNIYNYAMENEKEQYGYIKLKAMIAELIYEMCREGVVERRLVDDINVQRNIERVKGVLQYIENNYTEKISQSDVAKKFYFSTVYFSKYFKRTTGRGRKGSAYERNAMDKQRVL